MSTNPFTNTNNIFTNSQQKPNNIFGTQSQTNIFNNTSNNGAKIEIKNPVFNQQNDSNPFKSKNEPNLNNFNNKNNQNENSKNNQNYFFLFNTQQSQKSKEQNSSLNTNININQNIKNSTILNINSINNNNNTNQNTSNIFTNAPNKSNIFLNNTTNNNNNNIKTNTINIIPQKNTQEIKKEDKKESNIFLTQSNNILNKSNNIPSQSQIVNNSILSQEQKNENKITNILNPNPEKKEKSKVNEFINSLLAEDKLIFPEKEKKEYEKNQLSFKLNEEICEEFKDMLYNQKEKFEKFSSNARIIDKKFLSLINKMKNNASESLNNEIRFRNLFEKIKSTEKTVSNLKSNMNQKDKAISKGLDFLKKNLFINNNYNNNSLTLVKNNNLEEKIKFFDDLNETADKIRSIDNNLNIIWNALNKNEKNSNEINFIDTDKEYENKNKIKNINFILNNNINKLLLENNNFEKNNIILNNDIDGVFLERDNIDNIDNKNSNKQILYIEQEDINNLFTECYDGLYCQKCIQDEFDNKYNILKNKLIDKINQSNNNLGKDNVQKRDIEMEFNI